MTLDEIADSIPNGFHDAEIRTLNIDYVKRELTVDLVLWVADSSHDDPEMYRDAELKVLRLFYLVIEPPDSHYDYHEEKPLWIDAMPTEAARRTSIQLPVVLPEDAFTYSFFVHNWNAFIHIAAVDASISWK